MKRWDAMAAVTFTALCALAPLAYGADVVGYTYSLPVSAKGPYAGYHQFQQGSLNNKGQFSFDMINSADATERIFAWDGKQVIMLSDSSIKLPNGAAFSAGNVWTPFGLNNNGLVAWIADTDGSIGGVRYVVTYDLTSKTYSIIAKPGDPAPGGGTFGDGQSFGASNRMLADVNDAGQVVWNQVVTGGPADGNSGVFMYDPATKKITSVALTGTTTSAGKALLNAWWPMINNQGQVVFSGNTGTDAAAPYGVYVWDKGTVTPVAEPGTKVGSVTLASARWAHIANNGDVVFVGDTKSDQGGAAEVTADTGVFLYTAADKKLQTVIKPGDPLPGGGTFQGVEASRRVVEVNAKEQVVIAGVRDDNSGGIYLWQNGKLSALALDGDTLPGVGKVDGVIKGNGGVDGYHIALNDNGDVAFPVGTGGVEGICLATAPKPAAGR